MNDICTHLIELRGQVDDAEINTTSPFPLMYDGMGQYNRNTVYDIH
jgi:hypothetical protein